MRHRRLNPGLAALALLAFTGCGYVHFGHLPEPTTTVIGDEKLLKENTDLRVEKKILQQELALTRAQGDALRFAIENRAADGDTSKRLTEKLNDTSRELAALRASYAKLQAERVSSPAATPVELAELKSKLGATEDRLAGSLRSLTELQQEVTGLRSDVAQKRTENAALAEQVKSITAQNEEARTALAQLNTDLLAQKDSRTRAEQDAATLRTQLEAANTKISVLAQQRTAPAAEARALGVSDSAATAAAGADSTELRTQLETLRKKVWSLEAERAELQQQLASAESQIKTPGAAEAKALAAALGSAKMLREENDQLKTANTELAKSKGDLENQLAKAQAALPAAVGAIREELAQTQTLANSLTEENARLKARLSGGGVNITPTNRQASGVNATLVTTVPVSAGAGAVATVTTRPASAGAPRYHTVSASDTLARISILYYGTPARWNDILNANRDVLGEDNNLVIGRTLRIP
jgi:DNA repair exonuclease SbcCD ATPase subunit